MITITNNKKKYKSTLFPANTNSFLVRIESQRVTAKGNEKKLLWPTAHSNQQFMSLSDSVNFGQFEELNGLCSNKRIYQRGVGWR